MEINDNRTENEKTTHPWLVIGTDSFLSGWGKAENGASYAAWVCRDKDLNTVEKWVRNRGEMKRVRIALARDYKPSKYYCSHLTIYVVNDDHPSLGLNY